MKDFIVLMLFVIMIILVTSIGIQNIQHPESFSKDKISIDLPEEFSQATETDTLIAIKKNNTLYIQFNN